MKQIEVPVIMHVPDDYEESYINATISRAISEHTQGEVIDIYRHKVLARLPAQKKYIINVDTAGLKDLITLGPLEDWDKEDPWPETEDLWPGSVTLAIIKATSAAEAIKKTAAHYNLSDIYLHAYKIKDSL